MNPVDDHRLLPWAMYASLTRAEIRAAVRQGLDPGRVRDRPRKAELAVMASVTIMSVRGETEWLTMS